MATGQPKAIIMDYETGADMGELREGDRILRKESIDYLESTVELLPKAPYVKTFIKPMAQLAEELSGPESFMVYYLLQYLSYASGILIHPNGQPLTRTHIIEELKQSERNVDRLLDSLKEKEVLKKVLGARREVSFVMNPYLFMRGKRINRTLDDLFKGSKWAKIHDIEPKREIKQNKKR